MLFASAVASDDHWGKNNEYEQAIEFFNKLITGESVDISREANMSSEPHDLKRYVPNER